MPAAYVLADERRKRPSRARGQRPPADGRRYTPAGRPAGAGITRGRSTMDFQPSERCADFKQRLEAFMAEHIYPAESVYAQQLRESGDPHHQPAVMEELKVRAR